MKNVHTKFLLAVLSPVLLAAQPVLTDAGINPVAGDLLSLHNAQYVPEGSAGANQSWNLGFTSTGAYTANGVLSSTTPSAASFPNSNVAHESGGNYQYYNTSSSAWQHYGFHDVSGLVIALNDPEDILRFPVTYGSSFTDPWSTVYTFASQTFYRWGTSTATADGWGTLTTPAGTFSNVMRLHLVQTYRDSAYINNTPAVTDYFTDSYFWYLEGNHYYIATVYTITSVPGNTLQHGYYMQNVVSATEEFQTLRALSVLPNPASDVLNVNCTLAQQSDVTISIYDATGRLVGERSQIPGYEGENTYLLNVADLPEGAYYSTITMEGNIPVTRKFIVAH